MTENQKTRKIRTDYSTKYPFDTLAVGEEVFISTEVGSISGIRMAASWAKKRYAPKSFTSRAAEDGVFIKRVA